MKLPFKLLGMALLPITAVSGATGEAPVDSNINPVVISKLVETGDYLRSLTRFQVDADITQDLVLDNGQKVKIHGKTSMKVNHLQQISSSIESDRLNRKFYYDGKSITQYAPKQGYFATVPASNNVYDALHQLESEYGLQVPLEDLFQLGRDAKQLDKLTVAAYVGPTQINGQLCDHMAFRQEGVDWQLWLSRSKPALPCKLSIVSTDEAAQPEYVVEYHWKMKPTFKESDFKFKPGKHDQAIPLKKVGEQGEKNEQ
ncbi:DUF2092 domain-containing protein [Chitinibacter bivalviorum]|uniref:DUF2092 domain-containing protein n=1 Tax=Chitinibacter bivalviorum TaxID=2739434 RepID=A0A7H9BFG9_9NEIS|nr:DUF2092 domain-containing protein [Chitinibacter bivalviorum]QLG87450.1 DUF2092 domain-containing protein [Chitinibacter bivalviorum]